MNNYITAVDVLMPSGRKCASVLIYRQTLTGNSTSVYFVTPSSLRRAQLAQRELLERKQDVQSSQ